MLNKGSIISRILTKLGNTRSYNDDKSAEYKVCANLYEVEIKQMKLNKRFLFNATTIYLTYADRNRNSNGEFKYNLPNNFLNIVSVAGTGRQEGAFFFSPDQNLQITYCKDIPNNDIPDYMENYLVGKVGFEMSMAYSQYQAKAPIFQQILDSENIGVARAEINTSRNWMDEVIGGRIR